MGVGLMADHLMAEVAVLGGMLIDERIVGDVLGTLKPEDFTDEIGRKCFLAFRSLYMANETIDPVKVLHAMGGQSEQHRKWILDAMDRTPSAANYREYMAILQEQTKLRQIQSKAVALISADMDLDHARTLISDLQEVTMDHVGVECATMEDSVLAFYENLNRKPEYLPWGIDFLDQGLTAEKGDFIVLGGYASDGKTALALSLAYKQAETLRVGFFSLETKRDKLFSRIVAQVAKVSNERIRKRTMTEEDAYLIAQKANEIRSRKLLLIQASSMTVNDIRIFAKAKQLDVVYIDYLTLIPDPGKSDFEKATNISMGLHRMAQEDGIAVVALSQMSRPEKGKDRPPRMSDLRSSGQVEQDADIIMFVYREERDKVRSRRILTVAKNKEGLTGQIPLIFNGETFSFRPDNYAGSMTKQSKKEPPEPKQVTFYDLGRRVETPFDDDEPPKAAE